MSGAGLAAPEIAVELVHRLFVLIKAASVYGPDNEGYRSHSAAAHETLDAILGKEGAVRLEAREERLLFNEKPIRFFLGDAGVSFLTAEMKRRGVGGIEFRPQRGTSQLDDFVFAFNKAGAPTERPFDEFERLLKLAGVTAIAPYRPGPSEEGVSSAAAEAGGPAGFDGSAGGFGGVEHSGPAEAAGAARRAFLHAVNVVEDLMTRVRDGQEVDFEEPKRVVQGLAEQVISDAQTLFELSLLQNFDAYTYAHCVNVCVYSVAIGNRLGLSRESLSDLGFGALFHDVGKAKLPRELIDKPGAFDDREWQIVRRHPALGAQSLLAMRRPLDRTLARAISIAFEHHLGMKGQGYPVLLQPRRQELFSRICAVADAFDAMTSGRVYSKGAKSPDEALRRMVQRAGIDFDPLLLRLFINVVGIFPIGSALQLETGERGVVARNSSADLLHPQIVVFADRDGEKTRSELVDLGRQRPGAAESRRSISKTLDPRKAGIDAAAVLRARPASVQPPPEPRASGSPGTPRS